jgi:prevent-host-death family protein
MVTVGISEAESELPNLLERVAHGELITITKQGVPIAQIVPVPDQSRGNLLQVIQELKAFRKGNPLNGLSVRAMIEEGRR